MRNHTEGTPPPRQVPTATELLGCDGTLCVIHILPQFKKQDPTSLLHFVTPWPLRAGSLTLHPGQQAKWGHRTDGKPPPAPRRLSPFTRRAAKPALPATAKTMSPSFCFSQTAFVNRPLEAWLRRGLSCLF